MAKMLTHYMDIRLDKKPNKQEKSKLCQQLTLIHGGRVMSSEKPGMVDRSMNNGTFVCVDPYNRVVFFQQSTDHLSLARYQAEMN